MTIRPDVHRYSDLPNGIFLSLKSSTTGYYDENNINESFKKFIAKSPKRFSGEVLIKNFGLKLSGPLVLHGEWL